MYDFYCNEIKTLKKTFQTCFNEEFSEFNLKSSEIKLIQILYFTGGDSQAELAKSLDCDKAHIHRIVIKLLMKKIINISNKKNDNGRNFIITLTESGKEIAQNINKKIEKWQIKLIEGISKEDLETTKKVIKQLTKNIKKEKDNV